MCAAAAAVAVVAVVVAAAVAAAAAAATELLPLPTCARVQPGSVQSVVQLCALKLMLCAGSCARPGLRVSAQAAGAGQQVQGGLAEPPAGVRGSLGVAQRRAWAVRAQRHLTFAVLSIHSFSTQPLLELQCGWVGITGSTAFDWRHVSFPKKEVTQGPAPRDSLRDSLRRPPHLSLVRTSLSHTPLSGTHL